MVFVEGMSFYAVPPTTPETVRGKISFKSAQFIEFIKTHTDEKGWMNVKMMKSKEKGSIYFIVDSWKPKTMGLSKEESEAYHNRYQHPDPQVQQSNEKSAEQMFSRPLNDDEQFALSQVLF